MSKFSKDEMEIQDALSQITVDSTRLEAQVLTKLKEKPKNFMPNGMRRSMILVTAMSIMIVLTVNAAAFGKFDWFIEKINPDFKEIIESVGVVSEDQGIRMEVIGAQKYDNKAIVYLSLQDVSGQKRLTEQTEFLHGFSVKMNSNSEVQGQGDSFVEGMSWREKMLHFDEENNTAYYELNITADANSPLSDPLTLGSILIFFDKKSYENEPIPISLVDAEEANTVFIKENQIWGGTSEAINTLDNQTEVLIPGNYASMPHGETDQWISNVGFIDGKLHVQMGKLFNKAFGSTDVSLCLKNSKGELLNWDYELILFGNTENEFLNIQKDVYADAINKYNEYVFTVNPEEIKDFILCFTGSVYTGVEGKWSVSANLSDSSEQIRILSNDIPVEGHVFANMTISPLGLEVIGNYQGDECMASEMTLAFETTQGMIPLNGGGGSINSQNHSFNLSWDTNTSVDVTKITAVIINGTRIEVK